MSHIPEVSRHILYESIAEINHRIVGGPDSPLTEPALLLQLENPGLLKWGSHVSANIGTGYGGTLDYSVVPNERKVFDNAFLASFHVARRIFEHADITMPVINDPVDHYTWLDFTESPTIEDIFNAYNERQSEAVSEYSEFMKVIQVWSEDRCPVYYSPSLIGCSAIAAAEVLLVFRDHSVGPPSLQTNEGQT